MRKSQKLMKSMYIIREGDCAAAGVDPDEVRHIADGLIQYIRMATKLGIVIYCHPTDDNTRLYYFRDGIYHQLAILRNGLNKD